MRNLPLLCLTLLSLLGCGAIFGFFYAWSVSTLRGLDRIEPETAIAAMQAMNASVRNMAFGLGYFGTPVALLITLATAMLTQVRGAAMALAIALACYGLGVTLFTAQVNIPMNQALAQVSLPLTPDQAARIWADYSGPWQQANLLRCIASGLALFATAVSLVLVTRRS
ncbi:MULTISPECIES: DUF1772 domain-containing protein [Gemmobacter]|jgi:uncharacterized membrane protein|uniref:DUF1772 domain-containing protein n=1 Tax=Gemmobacter nanjingensis TaxID=488454 RepID=A0ABQ3FJ10_9RHOB|nr:MULTISPECIES: anthrone oxygenase family protein [Gemmobacter]GHC26116.1 hypothetical protein GCM10007291_27400 [Gemmobacter nanjingensis]